MKSTSAGFATLLMLSLVPVLLAGGLLIFSLYSFLKMDLGTLNLCRALQLEVQNKAARQVERLLKFNPRAFKLRLAQKRAEKALATALKSGNPAAVAAAEAFLLKIQLQRQALDLKQRALIGTANEAFAQAGRDLPRFLLQEWKHQSRSQGSWMNSRLQIAASRIPTLAVKPDFLEVAPLYELQSPFEELQSWSQHWILEIETTSWAKHFLKFQGRFQRSCSTSIYFEDEAWGAKLKKARFLWRGSS